MSKKLVNLANYLDELGFEKEANQVDSLAKRAFAPLGPIAIEKLIVTSPAWGPPAAEVGISVWIWVAGILGIGAIGAGVAYNQAEEEEAKRKVLLLEKIYNREVASQSMAGGTDPDLDSDELEVDFTSPRPGDIRRWYRGHPNKAEIDEELESSEVILFPQNPPVEDYDTDFDTDFDTDSKYEEEDDEGTGPLDCHFLCWAEQIKGSGGRFSYHFMYNYTDMANVVRDVLSKAILVQDYSLIKKILLPLELGRDDGLLSPIPPSAFRASFKGSPLKAAVCALCPGESYNIVYLSDTHKPKKTTEYDYNNKLLNMSEKRTHNIYFDPMLIKSSFPIMGTCKPTDGLRLVR